MVSEWETVTSFPEGQAAYTSNRRVGRLSRGDCLEACPPAAHPAVRSRVLQSDVAVVTASVTTITLSEGTIPMSGAQCAP